jgi:hypothetical protein
LLLQLQEQGQRWRTEERVWLLLHLLLGGRTGCQRLVLLQLAPQQQVQHQGQAWQCRPALRYPDHPQQVRPVARQRQQLQQGRAPEPQQQGQESPSRRLLLLVAQRERLCQALLPGRLAACWEGSLPHHLSSRCCCLLLQEQQAGVLLLLRRRRQLLLPALIQTEQRYGNKRNRTQQTGTGSRQTKVPYAQHSFLHAVG